MIGRAIGAMIALGMLAEAAEAQGERCFFDNTPNTRQLNVRLPSGNYNSFFGAGVFVRCPSKQLTLRADSLEWYGDEGRIYLLGNVRYNEPRLTLDSDYLTYYQQDERIIANGNVDARLPNGSSMRGPTAEYFRAIPDSRPVTRLFASGRPTINVVQEDTTGEAAPDSLLVVANNVLMLGDSLVYAGGAVIATRPEVEARGDSMMVDSESELLVIMQNPTIVGRGERPFTLDGGRIELSSTNRMLRRVHSMGNARATSEDMTLLADTIDLRMENDLLQRAMAWGRSRARANSPTQRITADSIDVRMPDQRVREMHAIRNAVAQGDPDTTRFRADTTDWMRGDTIIARFDSLAAPVDSIARTSPELRELTAIGNARSYNHMAPADTSLRRPAINYVRGREIIVNITDKSVSKVTVVEQAAGVYLEPRPIAQQTGPQPSGTATDTTARPPGARTPTRPTTRPPR